MYFISPGMHSTVLVQCDLYRPRPPETYRVSNRDIYSEQHPAYIRRSACCVTCRTISSLFYNSPTVVGPTVLQPQLDNE